MNSPFFSESASAYKAWSPNEGITPAPAPDWQDRLLGWWYAITATPEPPASVSFAKREVARRMRLFSTVGFFYLLILTIFFPASMFLNNHLTVYLDGLLIIITVLALTLNRLGRPFIAGLFLVLISELVLTVFILTTQPLDVANLQTYDLYLVVDLLAVSLLRPQMIFAFAFCNSLFIAFDLTYQPHTQFMEQYLTTQIVPAMASTIGLQILVAGVAYLWVRSATRAILRADQAEMVATLEHTIAENRASSDHARRQLEESIQRLVKVHIEAVNGQIAAKIPYPPEAKILWPLIGVINSLWMRLQHTHQMESELRQLKQAISSYVELLQRTALTQQPLPMQRTQTDLDPLILTIAHLLHAQRRQ